MSDGYQHSAQERRGRANVFGWPLIRFESTTSRLVTIARIADSVRRYLLAITTSRPPLLSRAMVATNHPSAGTGPDGEDESACHRATAVLKPQLAATHLSYRIFTTPTSPSRCRIGPLVVVRSLVDRLFLGVFRVFLVGFPQLLQFDEQMFWSAELCVLGYRRYELAV